MPKSALIEPYGRRNVFRAGICAYTVGLIV